MSHLLCWECAKCSNWYLSPHVSPLCKSHLWSGLCGQLNLCCCALVPSILSEYTVWRLSSPRIAPLEKESKRTGDVTLDSIAVSVFVVILVDFDKYWDEQASLQLWTWTSRTSGRQLTTYIWLKHWRRTMYVLRWKIKVEVKGREIGLVSE